MFVFFCSCFFCAPFAQHFLLFLFFAAFFSFSVFCCCFFCCPLFIVLCGAHRLSLLRLLFAVLQLLLWLRPWDWLSGLTLGGLCLSCPGLSLRLQAPNLCCSNLYAQHVKIVVVNTLIAFHVAPQLPLMLRHVARFSFCCCCCFFPANIYGQEQAACLAGQVSLPAILI